VKNLISPAFWLDIVKVRNKIRTWNVHALYTAGIKLANAVKEMKSRTRRTRNQRNQVGK